MKVFPVNFNHNKNIRFCSNEPFSTEDWATLKKVLTEPYRYSLDADALLKTNCLPTLNKDHFEYSDYKTLSPKERLIIDILNKKGNDKCDYSTARGDISIKKDAGRILEVASDIKKSLDCKYKNGYKLVGIGNSPAAIVETMQLLGADAVTLPFSKQQIEQSQSREFPYERFVPDKDASRSYFSGHFEKCSAKDWENYFKYYGIDKNFTSNTGKALIFTDYVCYGWTKKYIESILDGIGFNKNYEFIETYRLLPSETESKRDYLLSNCLDYSVFKNYARLESPKRIIGYIDILKHPEYIPSLPENFLSKLFRCALYKLIQEKL